MNRSIIIGGVVVALAFAAIVAFSFIFLELSPAGIGGSVIYYLSSAFVIALVGIMFFMVYNFTGKTKIIREKVFPKKAKASGVISMTNTEDEEPMDFCKGFSKNNRTYLSVSYSTPSDMAETKDVILRQIDRRKKS